MLKAPSKDNGELGLTIAGTDYILRFGSYAISQMETELNQSMMEIAAELEDPIKRRMKTLVAALWAGLQEFHPQDRDGGVDMRAAFSLIDKGGFVVVGTKIAEALELAFPEAEGATQNPPNRQARRKTAAKAR